MNELRQGLYCKSFKQRILSKLLMKRPLSSFSFDALLLATAVFTTYCAINSERKDLG